MFILINNSDVKILNTVHQIVMIYRRQARDLVRKCPESR